YVLHVYKCTSEYVNIYSTCTTLEQLLIIQNEPGITDTLTINKNMSEDIMIWLSENKNISCILYYNKYLYEYYRNICDRLNVKNCVHMYDIIKHIDYKWMNIQKYADEYTSRFRYLYRSYYSYSSIV